MRLRDIKRSIGDVLRALADAISLPSGTDLGAISRDALLDPELDPRAWNGQPADIASFTLDNPVALSSRAREMIAEAEAPPHRAAIAPPPLPRGSIEERRARNAR